jgi:chaperonin cofactor prefoldin
MRWKACWILVPAVIGAFSADTAWTQQSSQSQPPPPSQSQEQSPAKPKEDPLLEAARKAKASKEKSKPAKVLTEDDLAALPKKGVSTVGQEAAAADEKSSEPKPESAEAAKPGKPDEAYWRNRAGKLRAQIEAVDKEIEKLKEDIKKGGGSGFDASSGVGQGVVYIHDRNAQLKSLEQRRESLQKQMDQLQDEARKAGADPGWLR